MNCAWCHILTRDDLTGLCFDCEMVMFESMPVTPDETAEAHGWYMELRELLFAKTGRLLDWRHKQLGDGS